MNVLHAAEQLYYEWEGPFDWGEFFAALAEFEPFDHLKVQRYVGALEMT